MVTIVWSSEIIYAYNGEPSYLLYSLRRFAYRLTGTMGLDESEVLLVKRLVWQRS